MGIMAHCGGGGSRCLLQLGHQLLWLWGHRSFGSWNSSRGGRRHEITLLSWFFCCSKTLCMSLGSPITNFVFTPNFRHARYCVAKTSCTISGTSVADTRQDEKWSLFPPGFFKPSLSGKVYNKSFKWYLLNSLPTRQHFIYIFFLQN